MPTPNQPATPKLGFFFGAGAEAGYGFPMGGQFALDVFRHDAAKQKQALLQKIQAIRPESAYAANWLPREYSTKRVSCFGKADYRTLLASSLEYRQGSIYEFFAKIEQNIAGVTAPELTADRLTEAFRQQTGEDFGATLLTHTVALNENLAAPQALFESEHFSAFFSLLQSAVTTPPTGDDAIAHKLLRKCAVALLQLIIGTCSKRLVSELNQHIFVRAPHELGLFDDIGGIFSIDLNKAGIEALEIVLEEIPAEITAATSPLVLFAELARRTLERVLSCCLDYQELIDGHFRYLYSPKTEWSKFTKIAVFLSVVREYMAAKEAACLPTIAAADGYYHDLNSLVDDGMEIVAIGTSNYTHALETVLGTRAGGIHIQKLNGSLRDYYDPYLNRMMESPRADGAAPNCDHLLVPFLFTQSGVKPLTSISMSRRYVDLYDSYKKADAIVVVGFGFNGDDGHINAMLRALMEEEDKLLIVVCHQGDVPGKTKDIQKLLRLSSPKRLRVICATEAKRCVKSGKPWPKALPDYLSTP